MAFFQSVGNELQVTDRLKHMLRRLAKKLASLFGNLGCISSGLVDLHISGFFRSQISSSLIITLFSVWGICIKLREGL